MNAIAKIEPITRRGGRNAPAPAAPPATPTGEVARIVPSSPQLLALSNLYRAPENVRHVRVDEDVSGLAADIAAHGLLQSLIGYDRTEDGKVKTMIVGGGRRLQALVKLWEDGAINGAFMVPVLIRDVEDAVELSLAENLQQRTMSPVDEFLAFKALMDTGHHSPEGLAKRFGFSERVIRQRLRLADVEPEILNALAGREITLDAAMAYASTQDRALQAEVFKAEVKRGRTYAETHRVRDIRHAIAMKGIQTDSPLFKFVGEDLYASAGGGFEDDLFNEAGKERTLANPGILLATARQMAQDEAELRLDEFRLRKELAPTIVGFLFPDDLRVKSYGNTAPKPPSGFVAVEKYEHAPMWRTIRNNGIDAFIVVGIDDKGELVVWPRTVFVPKGQRNAIDQQAPVIETPRLTPEQQAKADRLHEVNRWARRFAVGPFTGTPLAGRAFWPTGYSSEPRGATREGVNGWIVPIELFVTEAEVAGAQAEAEVHVDALIAGRAAKAKRKEELLAADPPPAVILVDGLLHYRWSNGLWSDEPEPADGEERDHRPVAYRLENLLYRAETIGADWPSIEAHQADVGQPAEVSA